METDDFQNLVIFRVQKYVFDEIFIKIWSVIHEVASRQTDRQTNKQTDNETNERWVKHNLIGGGNQRCIWCTVYPIEACELRQLAPLRSERRVTTFSRTRMRCYGCRRKVSMLTKTHSGSVTSDQRFVNDAASTNSELAIGNAVSSSLSCYRPSSFSAASQAIWK